MTVTQEPSAQRTAETALDAAQKGVAWLRHSGIQHPSGGYHSWFDASTGEYPFLYSEVTGYQVTHAVWMAGRGDDEALAAAGRAVEWLATAVQPEPGAFRCLEALSANAPTAKADRRYTFDAGIILQGLVAHHVATGSELALKTSLETGAWLLAHMTPEGVFTPWPARGQSGRWEDAPGDWSTRPGVHHAKIGIGLAALGDATGDQRYTEAAIAACAAALPYQRPTGRFVTNHVTGGTNIHPHSYAAEALWAVGTATGREDFVAASERATQWLLSVTAEDGYPPRRWAPDAAPLRHPRVDGVSQTLRLAALHGLQDTDAARRIEATVLAHQVEAAEEPRADGGFVFGASSSGELLPHANVWVTAFAVQALLLAQETGPAALDWRHLV